MKHLEQMENKSQRRPPPRAFDSRHFSAILTKVTLRPRACMAGNGRAGEKVASTPKAGGTESRPRSHHRWYEQAITYLYLIRKDIYRAIGIARALDPGYRLDAPGDAE